MSTPDLRVSQLAVCLLKSVNNLLNSLDAVLVNQQVQKVRGVFAQASFLANLLDHIPLLFCCHDRVEQEIFDLLVVLEQRLQGIHVSVDIVQAVVFLSNLHQGIGICSTHGVELELRHTARSVAGGRNRGFIMAGLAFLRSWL